MTSHKSLTAGRRIERWPIAGAFTISRGAKTEAVVVVAELSRRRRAPAAANACPMPATARRREASPPPIEAIGRTARRAASTAQDLQAAMPAGAARNALDCALWDLEAKRARHAGRTTWPGCRRRAP